MVGAAWPLQTGTLKKAGFPAADTIPTEGATGWADSWLLATKAPHPNCAYLWMQYISTPKPQAQQALSFGETPANSKACAVMDQLEKGGCARLHADKPDSYFESDQVLEDTARAVRQRQDRLRAVPEVGQRLDGDHRLGVGPTDEHDGGPQEPKTFGHRPGHGRALAPAVAPGVAHDLATARVVPRDLSGVARGDVDHRVLERRPVHEQPRTTH